MIASLEVSAKRWNRSPGLTKGIGGFRAPWQTTEYIFYAPNPPKSRVPSISSKSYLFKFSLWYVHGSNPLPNVISCYFHPHLWFISTMGSGQVYVSSRSLACSCLEICHAAEKPAGEINGIFVKVRKEICKTTWTLHFYNSNLFVTVCNLILQD